MLRRILEHQLNEHMTLQLEQLGIAAEDLNRMDFYAFYAWIERENLETRLAAAELEALCDLWNQGDGPDLPLPPNPPPGIVIVEESPHHILLTIKKP